MKLLFTLALVLLPSFSFAEYRATETELRRGEKKQIRKAKDRLYTCARDIVSQRLGGKNGTLLAGLFLDDTKKPEASIVEIADKCERAKGELRSDADPSLPREYQLPTSFLLEPDTISLLHRLINPTVTCKHIDIIGAAVLGWGVGAQANSAYCVSTDGQRWVEAGVGAGRGDGVGAALFYSKQTTVEKLDPAGRLFAVRKSQSGFIGLVVAIAAGEHLEQENELTDDNNGWGIGALYFTVTSASVNLVVIPLSHDIKALRRTCENL